MSSVFVLEGRFKIVTDKPDLINLMKSVNEAGLILEDSYKHNTGNKMFIFFDPEWNVKLPNEISTEQDT